MMIDLHKNERLFLTIKLASIIYVGTGYIYQPFIIRTVITSLNLFNKLVSFLLGELQ